MPEDKSKIIIDEDWKARVEREKEEARKTPETTETDEAKESAEPEQKEAPPFVEFVSMLATQAMLALGVIAPRDAKEVVVDIVQAKYFVDTLMMLRDKTKGNLTPEEQGPLTEAIAQMQRAFALRAQQVQEAALKDAGVNPQDLRQKK